jgi:hypothetical protein
MQKEHHQRTALLYVMVLFVA